MLNGEELNFKYSGLFQNVQLRLFTSAKVGNTSTVTCSANIKLPILKKNFFVSTEFEGTEWFAHIPLFEEGATSYRVEKSEKNAEAIDPISFLLKLHKKDWSSSTVKLLIGAKVVELDVKPLSDGYEVKRREKEQSLIARLGDRGLMAIEIPVPVIGNLVIKRV